MASSKSTSAEPLPRGVVYRHEPVIQGLTARIYFECLRGAEARLFHGTACIREES